jgi:hypothetical protein
MLQYIPSEFGQYFVDLLGPYTGYKPAVDPSVLTSFASAAFRYGHSSLNDFPALNECGTFENFGYPRAGIAPPTIPPPPCQASYPNVSVVGTTGPSPNIPGWGYGLPATIVAGAAGGFENIARGLISTRTSPITPRVTAGLRDGQGTDQSTAIMVDLLAADITRARHNQVPNYATLRKTYSTGPYADLYACGSGSCACHGLGDSPADDPLECFSEVTGEVTMAQKLKTLYKKVRNIDPLIGMLAEAKPAGSSLGHTNGALIMSQYRRARDGDRYFYLNILNLFSNAERQEILKTTMGGILNKNLATPKGSQRGALRGSWDEEGEDSGYFPRNPFFVPEGYYAALAEAKSCSGAPNAYNNLNCASSSSNG